MRYPTAEDWAYLAGMIDGEGCVAVELFTGGSIGITVTIVNSHRSMLDWLTDRFGGCIRPRPNPIRRWKKTWSWSVTGYAADAILHRVSPILIIKQQASWLTREAWAQRTPSPWRRITPEIKALRRGYYLASRFLNQRGVPTDA